MAKTSIYYINYSLYDLMQVWDMEENVCLAFHKNDLLDVDGAKTTCYDVKGYQDSVQITNGIPDFSFIR